MQKVGKVAHLKPIQINLTNSKPSIEAIKVELTTTIELQSIYYLYSQALCNKLPKVIFSQPSNLSLL
uniref:1115_t:CDS:1 n=1 Tax=Dentiscutata erythropus TaxID=1348616 RepID=A0A9N8WGW4_9GLOM|nr:1115_t:CDS:2 [Dentiscutata erythropus]